MKSLGFPEAPNLGNVGVMGAKKHPSSSYPPEMRDRAEIDFAKGPGTTTEDKDRIAELETSARDPFAHPIPRVSWTWPESYAPPC